MKDIMLKLADVISMLEETKKEALNGVSCNSEPYMLIDAFTVLIKYKLMILSAKEETDG